MKSPPLFRRWASLSFFFVSKKSGKGCSFPMAMQQVSSQLKFLESLCHEAKLRFFMLVTTSFRKTPSKLQTYQVPSLLATMANHHPLVNTLKILDFLWVCQFTGDTCVGEVFFLTMIPSNCISVTIFCPKFSEIEDHGRRKNGTLAHLS